MNDAPPMLTLTPALARRLAVARQRLAEPRPAPTAPGMMETVRDLGCLQIDPINVVARSHLLVLFSRLGPYDPARLDTLLWQERQLFEYWAHCASIVPTEDYPLHRHFMSRYPWSDRTVAWVKQNEKLKRYVLGEIRRHGPLPSRALEEGGVHPVNWVSTGWTSGRNISRMLDYLWIGGKIMVARREGIQKFWDLSERCLPDWTPRHKLTEGRLVRLAAQQSLRALGVATPRQIGQHYIRGRYTGLPAVLASLEAEGLVARAQIVEGRTPWPGQWYIHTADAPLLESLANGDWSPRTVLLSPFDNLICDRQRTEQLFNFHFRSEIYTPKARRQFGFYVLPILHGDQLIGRIDSQMDRETGTYNIHAIHAEPKAPKASGPAVAAALAELATFLGAQNIAYPKTAPEQWRRALR
jgi:uncharacterized protein YcaQ